MARLSIPDEQTFAEFTVATPTTVFPITFRLISGKSDLTVLVDGEALDPSAYGFTGTQLDGGGYAGGTVTLNDTVDDVTVRIERDVRPTRTSQFAPSNSVPVGAVDMAFNRLTASQQDLDRRKIDAPYGDVAGQFLAFDAEGRPVASSGTGADAGLRTDMATPVGDTLLGTLQTGAGAVARTLQDRLRDIVYVNDFGAVGDGATDNTDAINAAILSVALKGGGEIRFGASADSYRVDGPCYLPSHVTLDLCGQTLEGGGTTTGTMFVTATVEAGVLTSNIGSANETKLVYGAGVLNGRVVNCGRIFHLRNFILGCRLVDLHTEDCLQFGRFERCFYMCIRNCSNVGTNDSVKFAFHFAEANNDIHLDRVTATKALGFLLEGGTTSFVFTACSFEGGGTAIKVKDSAFGLKVDSCYFENMPGGTVFDFTEANEIYWQAQSNLIQYVDVVIDDGGATSNGPPFIYGRWEPSNSIVGAGQTVGAHTFTALFNISGAGHFTEYRLPSDYTASTTTVGGLPANFNTSLLSNVSWVDNYAGFSGVDIRARAEVQQGVVPFRFSGNSGTPFPGRVSFCLLSFPTSGSSTLVIDTPLTWQPQSLSAVVILAIKDDTTTESPDTRFRVYGHVYGDRFKQEDSSGKTATISDQGGKLRVSIAGLDNTSGNAFVTGTIRMVG